MSYEGEDASSSDEAVSEEEEEQALAKASLEAEEGHKGSGASRLEACMSPGGAPSPRRDSALRAASESIADDLASSMEVLKLKELSVEASIVIGQLNMESEAKEMRLIQEQRREIARMASMQEQERQQLRAHLEEELDQKKRRFVKKMRDRAESKEEKAYQLKLRQLRMSNELALAQSVEASERAARFGREVQSIQTMQEERRAFSKETRKRRAKNLALRQLAIKSTNTETDMRFLKREQDKEQEQLREMLDRESEQSRLLQSLTIQHAQENFEMNEGHHRAEIDMEAVHLNEAQVVRAQLTKALEDEKKKFLQRAHKAKVARALEIHDQEERELRDDQKIERQELVHSLKVECDTRLASREAQLRDMAANLKSKNRRAAGVDGDSDTSDILSDMVDESGEGGPSAVAMRVKKMRAERTSKASAKREAFLERAAREQAEYASERQRKRSEHEAKLARMRDRGAEKLRALSAAQQAALTDLKDKQRHEAGRLLEAQGKEMLERRRTFLAELDELARKHKDAFEEMQRSFPLERKYEELLHQILPPSIAEELANSQTSFAKSHANVGIVFIDVVGFTELSGTLEVHQLLDLLTKLFGLLDGAAEKHHVCKIKTIGDAWMGATGIPTGFQRSLSAAADFCLEVLHIFERMELRCRVGFATGDVIAGVLGTSKPVYDIWGPSVNLASRMESCGEPGMICVAPDVQAALAHSYVFEARTPRYIKGIGELETFWLTGKRL